MRKYILIFSLLLILSACSLVRRPEIATPVESPPTQQSGALTNTAQLPPASPTLTPTPVPIGLKAAIEQEELSPLSPVSLHFNQPMDPASAQPALLTYPWVEGDVRWEAGNTILKFTPKNSFTPARQYQLFLSQDLKSASGEGFSQPQHWQIQVADAPHVVSHSPASTLISERQPEIRITFDRPMDLGSVLSGLSVQPQISIAVDMQAETVILRPEKPFEPGTRYNFTLAGATHDAQGIPLGEDYRWAYSLPDLVSQFSGPVMEASYAQPEEQPLRLDFNYGLDRASFAAAVRVSTPEQGRVEGKWSWVQQEAVFEPAGGYQYNTTYTIAFDGELRDDQGLLLPPPKPLVYHMPSILAYWPGEMELAAPESSINLQFALATDHDSAQAAFQIEPDTPGKFRWQANSLEFVPDDLLQFNTVYTVTLGTDALDAQGKPLLEQPLTWHFKTQPFQPGSASDVSFGDFGPNAQVVDFDGRRAIQFITGGEVQRVNFGLYRLSPGAVPGSLFIRLQGSCRLRAHPNQPGRRFKASAVAG